MDSRWKTPMKMILIVISFVVASLLPLQSNADRQATKEKPGLTILVAVDQFGAGYLEKYQHVFKGGFRRMLDEGMWFTNASVDHAPTLSLPGHTTLATGANPKTHGITSNAWLDPRTEADSKGLYHAVVPHLDSAACIVGDEDGMGFSPRNVKVEGLADWFRNSSADVRTVALSVSPLAVLYGGRFSAPGSDNHVYWLGSTGKFVTSSYYRDDYPDWVNRFNEIMAERYLQRDTWKNTVPVEHRELARMDKVSYEFDGVNTSFPHKAGDMIKQGSAEQWFGRFSPYQNNALFDLAKEAVHELKLGQRGHTDFLSIAVKLTDRIGHDFGPQSQEQLDVIFRLDRLLGDFLSFLDETVGEGNYIVALSADHGAPNVSEYELEHGRMARRISSEDFEEALESVRSVVKNHTGDKQKLPRLIAADLERFSFINRAMTSEDLLNGNDKDPLISAYRNSFLADQVTTYPLWTRQNRYGNLVTGSHPANYGVIVELTRGANIWAARSTHGSSWDYDREVPILLMGTGVKTSKTAAKVFTRDIAPTLAYMSGVRYPQTVDGQMIEGVN